MQKSDFYVAQMLMDLIGRKTGEISHVDYKPQKPAFPRDSGQETRLSRSSPESLGVSSAWVSNLFRRLSDPALGVHKIMILRGNYVIAETAIAPYCLDDWHVTHSLCKSVTGMAIGLLIDEEKLAVTDRLVDIFKDERSLLSYVMLRDTITIRHLLTMSTGVKFNEAGAIAGNSWSREFMEAGSSFEPGAAFEYNSMNSYILSAVVTKLTGETMMEYLRPRLWDPLGIKRVFWEMSPEMITKGGWGLFLRIEDMAKLGRLYMQNGVWQGRRVLSEEWVRESTKVQIHTGMEHCETYGYHLWVNDDRGVYAYSFNGMLGQNVFCYPDLDMVICVNAGNDEIFQQGRMSRIIRQEMRAFQSVEMPLPDNNAALGELKMLCRRLSGRTPVFCGIASGGWKNSHTALSVGNHGSIRSMKTRRRTRLADNASARIRQQEHLRRMWLKHLNGSVYDLDNCGEGIFPLLMQVFHNNFTDGITAIGFRRNADGASVIDFYEGNAVYPITCGFYGRTTRSRINMHGEIYDVAVCSDFTTDENDRPVLKNEIFFLEEAVSRIINIYFEPEIIADSIRVPDQIEVRMDEKPGSSMIMPTLEMITTEKAEGLDGFLIKQFAGLGGMEAIHMLAYATIRPVLHGRLRVLIDQDPERSS
ncbi:MAG: beta-lactamase family protein [Lachnospiraceae bacterium]|nr:beta-lactamase family protein [Lachnospiraceae bacterium]